MIYVGSWDGNLYALNLDGSLKWKYDTGNYIWSSPALGADGTLYVGSYDDNLYALNPDGSVKWKYATGYSIESSPAIGADGTLYVGSWDHNFYAIGPGTTTTFTITPNAGTNGMISPATAQTVHFRQ